MKWRITFLTLLFSVFCSLFVSSSTYAVSDLSVTYTANSSISSGIFPDCKTADCIKQYNYLIIETSSSFSGNSVIYFDYACRVGNSNSRPYLNIPLESSDGVFYIWKIPSCLSGSSNLIWGTSAPPVDITFTLTESYAVLPSGTFSVTENGTYDISEYEYVDVDVPATETPGDYDDEFNGVIVAIYTCGAIILVIYFFYCIYRMIIKTAGGV